MEKYIKYSILGFTLPSFLVFYGIRQGAYFLLHGLFYTLTMKGLNITKYNPQEINLMFFDPLVLLNPRSFFETTSSYSNPIFASLDSALRLMESNSGWYFFNSFYILVIGFIFYFYFNRKYGSHDETELLEEKPTLNPYSQITLILTFSFIFFFQITSFILLPLENDILVESFSVPIGSIFILLALINVINNLDENYLLVMKWLGRILLGINAVALVLAWFMVNDFFFYKVVFLALLFIAQYILYYNVLFLDELKEQNQQISGSLIRQLFYPLTMNKNIPYYESTLVLLLILGFRMYDQISRLGSLTFLFILIIYGIAFAGVLLRQTYGPLVALGILGYDFLMTIYNGVYSILAIEIIVFGLLINLFALYACYKELFELNKYSEKQESYNLNNLVQGRLIPFLHSSWVKYIGLFIAFLAFDFLYGKSISQSIIFNMGFFIVIGIILTLMNMNKYNFEGKLQSIYVSLILTTFFFVFDILFLVILSTLNLEPIT